MTPFQIWLNEAVTVHMERKRAAELFGDTFRRLVIVSHTARRAYQNSSVKQFLTAVHPSFTAAIHVHSLLGPPGPRCGRSGHAH